MSKSRLSVAKRIAFSLVASIIVVLLLEGICSFSWLIADYRHLTNNRPKVGRELKEEFHCEYDDQLGWTNTPSKFIANIYGNNKSITINQDGLRGLEDYIDQKPQDRIRVVCLGDSFTMGYGVDDKETYPFQLEKLNPGIQAVNMGLGGYSIGQCFLWYKRLGEQLEADVLVLSIIVGDIRRLGTKRTLNGFATPQFKLNGDRIETTNLPVPQKIAFGQEIVQVGEMANFMSEKNAISRSIKSLANINEVSEGERSATLAAAMVLELNALTKANDQEFVLVFLPTLIELNSPHEYAMYQAGVAAFSELAKNNQFPFLDLRPAFADKPTGIQESFFLDETHPHYSPAGNAFVTRELNQWLADNLESYPSIEKEKPLSR